MSNGTPSEPFEENDRREIKPASTEAPFWGSLLLRFAPWAAAAVLAFIATWLAFQNISLRTEASNLIVERRLAEVAYRTAQNQLAERSLFAETMINELGSRLRRSENLGRLTVSNLSSPVGRVSEARAAAVWDPDQQAGLLTFDNLPSNAGDQDYQIWIVDLNNPDPVSAGVFHVAVNDKAILVFKPTQPIKQAATFSISLEKKGGGPKAEGPLVLLGKLPGN